MRGFPNLVISSLSTILRGGRIEFLGAGEGRCLQAVAAEDDAGLYAPLCGDDNLQRWEVVGSGQVRLVNTELCITVGGQHTQAPAGPLVRRDLIENIILLYVE